jgi:DNA invertase Pin-like site-specific DNA recombinase
MPVAIYARISSDRDSPDSSTQRQIDLCVEELAKRPGLTLYPNTSADPKLGGYRQAFHDDGISAYSGKHRPAWAAVEALALEGKIDGIIAYSPDRIHRRTLDMLTFIGAVDKAGHGMTLHFHRGNDQDFQSAQGRLVASILAVFAGAEVDQLTQRIVDQKAKAAESGHWNGGRAPLGYHAVRPTKIEVNSDGKEVEVEDEKAKLILVKHPVVAPALEQAINDYLSGKSLITCLEDFRSATGLTTEYTSFKYSLLSPSISGQRMHFPTALRKGRTVHKLYTTPKLLEENAEFYPAKWEAIISADKWRLLRDKMVNNPTNTSTRGKKPVKSMLAGLIFCSDCGAKMGNDGTSYKIKGDPTSGIKHYPTYRCSKSNRGCGKMQIGARLVDPFIAAEFKIVLGKLAQNNSFVPVKVGEQKIIEIENAIAEIDRVRAEDYDRLRRGVINEAEYVEYSADGKRHRAELENELSELRLANAAQSQIMDAEELFDSFDPSQKRAMLSMLIQRIEIRKVPMRGGARNVLDERRISVLWDMGGGRWTYGGEDAQGRKRLLGEKPADWDRYTVQPTAP